MVKNHGFKNVVDLFVHNIIVESKTLQTDRLVFHVNFSPCMCNLFITSFYVIQSWRSRSSKGRAWKNNVLTVRMRSLVISWRN